MFTLVVFDSPEDLRLIERMADVAHTRGHRFLLVRLVIDADENERRIAIPSRTERMKMTSVPGLRELRAHHRLADPEGIEVLEIDVTSDPAHVVAAVLADA